MQSIYDALQTEIEFLQLVSHNWLFNFCSALFLLTGKNGFTGIHLIECVVLSHLFALDTKKQDSNNKQN